MFFKKYKLWCLLFIPALIALSGSNSAFAAGGINVELKNGKYGCLQLDLNDRRGNGFNVHARDNCKFSVPSQQWQFDGNTVGGDANGALVMAASGRGTKLYCLEAIDKNNENVIATECDYKNVKQQFTYDGNHIKSKSGRCLDAVHKSVGGSHNVILWNCNKGEHQNWFSDLHRASKAGYGCLEMGSVNLNGGLSVHVSEKCENRSEQRWRFSGEKVSAYHKNKEYCLAVTSKYQGSNVYVTLCDSSDPNQRFKQHWGTITTKDSNGKFSWCLDAVSQTSTRLHEVAAAKSRNVVLWTCHRGRKHQQWGYVTTKSGSYAKKFKAFQCKSPMSTDGCSVVDSKTAKKFKSACVKHDYCYRSPWWKHGWSKGTCENDFLDDLGAICNKTHNDGSPAWSLCMATAMGMDIGVGVGGANSFESGQKWSEENCL